MKKNILKRLICIILTAMFLTLALNFFLQIGYNKRNMIKNSQIKLNQIEQILLENQKDIKAIKQNLREDYITLAKAAAYIVQNHEEVTGDLAEMQKIADLLQVDEFHIFNKEGTLYSGSVPKYYGMNFNSGEQMQYFLPMLEDTSLELCQDLTPNTAEHKLMQYAAVWREDKKEIIQIGMEPQRLLEAMKKNELSYVFSLVTAEADTVICAVDKRSGRVLGSTLPEQINRGAQEIGIVIPEKVSDEKGFAAVVDKVPVYCVFREVGDNYIGIYQSRSYMYGNVQRSITLLFVYLMVLAVLMIGSIVFQVDRLIISGIERLKEKMTLIAEGNLDTVVDVTNTTEFEELSENINSMVRSLLNTTDHLSRLFESANISIGIYQYRQSMKRVLATQRALTLLAVEEEREAAVLADKMLFETLLDTIRQNPVQGMMDIYRIPQREEQYVRIQSFTKDGDTFGVIADATEEVLEKNRIEMERDSDLLTGLCSRRAFYNQMETLFACPEEIGYAAMLMADIDSLKTVNDTYGHTAGDLLIRAAGRLFGECRIERNVAARLSGDEFALFLYGCSGQEELEKEIRRIREAMMERVFDLPNGGQHFVRMSAGYVFYPEYQEDFRDLMQKADKAMYRAKRERASEFVKYE